MEPILGQLVLFGTNWPPRGWASCNGQLLSIAENTALFSLLGTTYGGDGRSTFALPDLRGRAPLHYGTTQDVNRPLGSRAGVERVTLQPNNLPPLEVQIPASEAAGSLSEPTGNVFGRAPIYASGSADAFVASPISLGGSSQPIPVGGPTLAMNWCIALVGTFPSRN